MSTHVLFLHSPQTKLCYCTSAASLRENHETLLRSLPFSTSSNALAFTAPAAIKQHPMPALVPPAACPQSHRRAAARKKTERRGSSYRLASMQMLAFGTHLAA